MTSEEFVQTKWIQGFILYNVILDYDLMVNSGLVGKAELPVPGKYK